MAEITQIDSGPGWNLHAKTGWQNAPGAGVNRWFGWVQCGEQITPFALNIFMAGATDAPKREQLGRASLQAMGVLPLDTPPKRFSRPALSRSDSGSWR